MARHIMAVCVVCLLCADRIPCQQHFDGTTAATIKSPPASVVEPLVDDTYKYQENKVAAVPKNSYESSRESSIERNQRRQKRHVAQGIDNSIEKRPEITEDFLRRIFDEYGENDGSTIKINEFRRMLKQLGLKQLLEQRLSSTINNDTCISDVSLVDYIKPHDLSHRHREEPLKPADCQNNSSKKLCNGVHQEHEKWNETTNYTLGEEEFLNLCPVLLYQLSSHSEIERSGCIRNVVLTGVHNFEEHVSVAKKDDVMYVWVYAFASVSACGILGLVGVAIIPFMDSRFYKHIIQFLVSLAVGTMTGDALLHLLPHSLAGQSESNMIFKGLTCMSGILFFYITEHGFTMISEWRKSIAKQDTKKPSRVNVVRDPDASINNSVAGDKLCKSKYSSYPYCYDEIAMDTKHDVWMHLPNNTSDGNDSSGNHISKNTEKRGKNKEASGNLFNDAHETAQSLLSTSHNNYAPISELNHSNRNHHNHNHHQQVIDSNTLSTTLDDHSIADGVAANGNDNVNKERGIMNNDTVTVILREHESSHHGHSHKHGHVHSPPESLSAVAWMIIMGDGLHNFTDGMAIGAAFAENIAGGFSTSLAVFCHELPHELGDFAILMKAGMSVKSAVYYNLLTGILSFIGMIFGIVFGQSQETAQWMFAAAAGLFIYIALVDMMPELSAAHKTLQQFALQVLGMSSGVFLMLLIAIFEGDLMRAFSSSPTVSLPLGHNHLH